MWILSHGFLIISGEDINEDNKKGDPTTGGSGGTEGGTPVPGNTIEG